MKNQNSVSRAGLEPFRPSCCFRSTLGTALLLISQAAAVMPAMAAWTPPEGSVTPPAVLRSEDVFGDVQRTPDGNFLPSPPSVPIGSLVVGSDGALYGLTAYGGAFGYGTAYKVTTDGTFTKLHDFNISTGDGFFPVASLVRGTDGNLYGSAPNGGTGAGIIFRLGNDGAFATLHQFNGSDGGNPMTSMVVGPDGALYGSTWAGGTLNAGVIFKLETNGNFTVMHELNGEDGANFNINYDGQEYGPPPQLVVGQDGALYGVATYGGRDFAGTIFRIQTDGTFAKLHEFDGGNYGPKSALVVGADGAMYGSTAWTLFKVETNGNFTTLQNLGSIACMVRGADGGVYCSRQSGGAFGYGSVFRLEPDGSSTTIHDFSWADGGAPFAMVVGADGAFYGTAAGGLFFRLETNGTFVRLSEGWDMRTPMTVGPDGALYGSTPTARFITKLVWSALPAIIQTLIPASTIAGSGDVSVTINGQHFQSGAHVFFGATEVAATYINPTQLQAVVPAAVLPSPTDFATVEVTVLNPSGDVSKAVAFTVIGAGVSGAVGQVEGGVAAAGETASVQTPPSTPDAAGVTASLENSSGTTTATITAATYTENPTPAPAFEAGGGFVDLKVSGADPGDRLLSSFYYPQTVSGAAETALALKFFNGSAWIDVSSSGGMPPAKDTTDNLDGTISGGRFQVVFDNTSTPKITELNGTVFAVAIPDTTPPTVSCPNITVPCDVNLLVPVTYPAPTVSDNIDPAPRVTYSIPSGSGFGVGTTTVTCTVTDAAGNTGSTTFTVTRQALEFEGFDEPIDGADATGGSYSNTARTLKLGNKIRISFELCGCGTIADTEPHRCCGERHSRHSGHHCSGAHVTTGAHTLQVIKWTSQTDAETPLDADSADPRTEGNQFRLVGHKWVFVLDTRDTGMSRGKWQIVATLSDGSQHSAWVQMK